MKKTLSVILGVIGMGVAQASNSNEEQQLQHEPLITLQYGIMHSECQESIDAIQYVPSVLYGFSLGCQWKLAETESLNHYVGLNIGYYTGSQTDIYYGSEKTTDVDVIPLLLTYNMEYQLNDKLCVYGGIRGGAIIRDTSMNYKRYGESFNDTSVNPMLGVGIGARAWISDNWAFDVGYDFSFAFGEDCELGAPNEYLLDTSDKCSSPHNARYYGTIKVGFSYSF